MIGKRIAEYRRLLKLKVGELAKLIGISQGSLSDIENIKSKPSADTIEALVRNTDISPAWLLTGEGPKRKGDYRTGDGNPFSISSDLDQGEIDHDLMWDVVNNIQTILLNSELDPQSFSHDKRLIIQNLLYSDAKQKGRQIDERYAGLLFRLTYCDVCEVERSKERWKEKWGIKVEPGQDLEDVSIQVKTPPGLKCPMEGMHREYITDSIPVTVHCTAFYRKLVDEGSLILVNGKQEESARPQPAPKTGNQITQTVSGKGHKVAGRDINEGSERSKK